MTNSHNAPNESKDPSTEKRKLSIIDRGGGSILFDGKKISDETKIAGGMVALKNA